jgi:hypothetical protein
MQLRRNAERQQQNLKMENQQQKKMMVFSQFSDEKAFWELRLKDAKRRAALQMFNPRTERGKARLEFYSPPNPNKKDDGREEFGLAKRTNRQKRGIRTTHPKGYFADGR